MAWNRPENEWQDGWLEFMGTMNGGFKGQAPPWYEQPTHNSYIQNGPNYPPWPQPTATSSGGSHMHRTGLGGYGGNVSPNASRRFEIKQPAKPMGAPNFDALRALQGDDGSDDDKTAISGAAPTDSSDDDARLGKKATQAECEEAESIVRTALQDVQERDSMRSKVSMASNSDLQAMMNARLKKQACR